MKYLTKLLTRYENNTLSENITIVCSTKLKRVQRLRYKTKMLTDIVI